MWTLLIRSNYARLVLLVKSPSIQCVAVLESDLLVGAVTPAPGRRGALQKVMAVNAREILWAWLSQLSFLNKQV